MKKIKRRSLTRFISQHEKRIWAYHQRLLMELTPDPIERIDYLMILINDIRNQIEEAKKGKGNGH